MEYFSHCFKRISFSMMHFNPARFISSAKASTRSVGSGFPFSPILTPIVVSGTKCILPFLLSDEIFMTEYNKCSSPMRSAITSSLSIPFNKLMTVVCSSVIVSIMSRVLCRPLYFVQTSIRSAPFASCGLLISG